MPTKLVRIAGADMIVTLRQFEFMRILNLGVYLEDSKGVPPVTWYQFYRAIDRAQENLDAMVRDLQNRPVSHSEIRQVDTIRVPFCIAEDCI